MRDIGIRRSIYYRMSPAWRRRSRRIAFGPLDAWTVIRGRPEYNGIPLPLRGEVFTGGGDFLATGLRFREHFERLGGLTPDDDVLEIGSGLGRMAIPLTDLLSSRGSYLGFDVVPSAVADCQRRISTRFPAFAFVHVDVMNDLYTESGAAASSLTFPADDDAFDFAFATSVFSHMDPDDVAHYLTESRRVVRNGGRLMVTFFMLDEEAAQASARSSFRFRYPDGRAWYMSLSPRSANVALAPETFSEMARSAGWTDCDIRPGSWSGRSGSTTDYQDIAVLR